MFISIITATYNRANTLPKLYESLIDQKNTSFEWILIDDGSVDETEELVKKWLLEDKVKIKYLKKINDGKTRAVQFGFSQDIKGDYTFILDSDDCLSSNSLAIIKQNLISLSNDFIGIIGLKYDSNNNRIGQEFKNFESSYIDLYFGKNAITGDKLFVIKTDVYKKSIVPPFEGEKFMPDNLPYIRANNLGKYKLINECLYVGDYLEDGMTLNIYKMAISNIQGYIFEKRELQKEKLSFKYKIINTIKFIHYCTLNKMSMKDIFNYSGDKKLTCILYLPTLVFFSKKRKLYSNLNTKVSI